MRRVLSLATLLTSTGTLLCCAIPALLVTLGLGSALASLISTVPQLVWFSEHKAVTFGASAALLIASAIVQLRARRVACPADPSLQGACLETRSWTGPVFWVALGVFSIGALFAWAPSWLGWA